MNPSSHSICKSIVTSSVEALQEQSPPKGRSYWLEADLERFMFEAAVAKRPRAVAAACRNFTAPIPGWWPGAGRVDLMVEVKSDERARCDLYELKWCSDDKIEEALWDALKMACAHDLPQVRHTYLVFGAPTSVWSKPPVGAELFAAGDVDIRRLLQTHVNRWNVVLSGGKGRPYSSVERVTIEAVVNRAVESAGQKIEIRAVCLKPRGSKSFNPSEVSTNVAAARE